MILPILLRQIDSQLTRMSNRVLSLVAVSNMPRKNKVAVSVNKEPSAGTVSHPVLVVARYMHDRRFHMYDCLIGDRFGACDKKTYERIKNDPNYCPYDHL